MNYLPSAERLLLTLWVGAMWTVGYIVAPTLFHMLDDRQLAGQLAGQLFYIVSLIGMACAPVLLIRHVMLDKQAAMRQWRIWVLLGMLVLVAAGLFVIQPMMQDLKAQGIVPGSEVAASFGRLHGISSILYLLTSLGGLALVLAGDRARISSAQS